MERPPLRRKEPEQPEKLHGIAEVAEAEGRQIEPAAGLVPPDRPEAEPEKHHDEDKHGDHQERRNRAVEIERRRQRRQEPQRENPPEQGAAEPPGGVTEQGEGDQREEAGPQAEAAAGQVVGQEVGLARQQDVEDACQGDLVEKEGQDMEGEEEKQPVTQPEKIDQVDEGDDEGDRQVAAVEQDVPVDGADEGRRGLHAPHQRHRTGGADPDQELARLRGRENNRDRIAGRADGAVAQRHMVPGERLPVGSRIVRVAPGVGVDLDGIEIGRFQAEVRLFREGRRPLQPEAEPDGVTGIPPAHVPRNGGEAGGDGRRKNVGQGQLPAGIDELLQVTGQEIGGEVPQEKRRRSGNRDAGSENAEEQGRQGEKSFHGTGSNLSGGIARDGLKR